MDDGVAFLLAPRIADYLEERGYKVNLSLEHQLLPESAADLEETGFAIFVDASVEKSDEGFRIREIEAREVFEGLNLHSVSPEWILAMGVRLHGKVPEAWLVTVEGELFDFGEELTPLCSERMERALAAFKTSWEKRENA